MLVSKEQTSEIKQWLIKYDVNISKMCDKLNMNRKTFYNKLNDEKNSYFTILEYEEIRKFVFREE